MLIKQPPYFALLLFWIWHFMCVVLSSFYVRCVLHNKVNHNHRRLLVAFPPPSLLMNYRLFAHSSLSSTNSVWVQAEVQVEMGAARVNYKLARKLVCCRRISGLSSLYLALALVLFNKFPSNRFVKFEEVAVSHRCCCLVATENSTCKWPNIRNWSYFLNLDMISLVLSFLHILV